MASGSSRSAAQGLADHFNSVLNQTLTDARLAVIIDPRNEDHFTLARLVDRQRVPLQLRGSSLRLFITHAIQVVEGHCRTVSYSYRLQLNEMAESWLIRWEYYRQRPKPDYEYPLGHVHMNARLVDQAAESHVHKPVARLHIPTGRVPFELVVWHLLSEWGVASKATDWQKVLEESIAGFNERRTAP